MKKTSEKKIRANRKNGALSKGPGEAAIAHTRFNARQHGLYSRLTLSSQESPESRRSREQAWARVAPRNSIEAGWTTDLLETLRREDRCLEVERTVLTRRPAAVREQPYPFLQKRTSLSALKALCRYEAHLCRASEKAIVNLIKVRKEDWSAPEQLAEPESRVPEPSKPGAEIPPLNPTALEECLADQRLVFQGEDPNEYATLVRDLWATLRPSNPLEEFVCRDFVQAQWRLRRVLGIEQTLFERLALSDLEVNCGPGFAFVADAQKNQALEALTSFEAVLRRRIERRLELLRKIRAEWIEEPEPSKDLSATTDPPPSDKAPASEPQPTLTAPPAEPGEATAEANHEKKETQFKPHRRVTFLQRLVQSVAENIWKLKRTHLPNPPGK